jgi:hypothetical protein
VKALVAAKWMVTAADGAIGILLPKNQRQHRTFHISKDVLLYALC